MEGDIYPINDTLLIKTKLLEKIAVELTCNSGEHVAFGGGGRIALLWLLHVQKYLIPPMRHGSWHQISMAQKTEGLLASWSHVNIAIVPDGVLPSKSPMRKHSLK